MMSPRQRLNENFKMQLKKKDDELPEVEENFNLSEEEKGFDELPDFSQLQSQQTSRMISQID